MTTGRMPICEACKHLERDGEELGYRCEAFPDGIPEAIAVDGFDHRKPFEGDGGVRFELEVGQEPALAAYERS